MQPRTRYLVVIDAAGGMVARMFDAEHRQFAEFDASSSEVAVMTHGLVPERTADEPPWRAALAGHSTSERREAEVYTLDV